MRRGNLITVSLPGNYGKPRPALIIQSDLFDVHPSITILPITSELHDAPLFRILVEPDSENCLHHTSQIMVDKTHTIHRDKAGEIFGKLSDELMLKVNRSLAMFLGFG